jgi:hypothetical protein
MIVVVVVLVVVIIIVIRIAVIVVVWCAKERAIGDGVSRSGGKLEDIWVGMRVEDGIKEYVD